MYYLQSRYYDPQVGRFINGDEIEFLGASGTLFSYNLFSYGENNIINVVDPKGTDAYWITDSKTLSGLGHSSLLIQTNGSWYYFYFGAQQFKKPINGPSKVIFEKISLKYSNGTIDFSDLNKQLKGKTNRTFTGSKAYQGKGYNKAVFIQGDFNKAYDYVTNTVKYMKYNVAKENCAWLCIEVLQHCDISDMHNYLLEKLQYSTKYVKIRVLWRYVTIASYEVPNVIVPSRVHSKIASIFNNRSLVL